MKQIDMLDFENNEKLLQEYAEAKKGVQNASIKNTLFIILT